MLTTDQQTADVLKALDWSGSCGFKLSVVSIPATFNHLK